METAPVLKSPFQQDKEKRNQAILHDYRVLSSVPKSSKVAINKYIMRKYGLRSMTSVYQILRQDKQANGGN